MTSVAGCRAPPSDYLSVPIHTTNMADPRVILKRIAHVHYSHADIDKTRQFLQDFGLTEVAQVGDKHFWKGYGNLPFIYVAEKAVDGKALFKGATFEAESKEELEKAAKLKVSFGKVEISGFG
jgi:hypothetical protein